MPASGYLLPANPKAGYLAHKAEIDQAVQRVLEGGWYILGQEARHFEQEFAHYVGVSQAVGVANGTDALHLALRACGVGNGDAVLTVSHTAVATVAAIELTGAAPILIDIDPVTYTMDPNRLEETIRCYTGGARLRAVVPVHLYGHPADMPAIVEIARRHGLSVVEDCAQAHGATLHKRKTGTWGDIAAFSFYPTKNLGGCGDGGAVVTADPILAEKVRLLREYGWRDRYISALPGVNSRLDEIQAALLRVKLKYLDEENARRRELARRYDEGLQHTFLALPHVQPEAVSVYHLYVIRSKERDGLRTYMESQGVGTAIHYPVPVHLQPAYRNRIAMDAGGLGNTEVVSKEILSLPMHPQMSNADVERVCQVVKRYGAPQRTEAMQAA